MITKTFGPVTISEEAGIVTVSASAALGGGAVAGVASVQASITLSAVQLLDAALVLAEAKFPTVATEIAALKVMVDAEIAKA